ncbi:MAG: DUF4835 family protein [Ignavibacteria bacterium]|nr:DUF4835 family protein [Ignavibacteria bacterium]
MTKIILIIVLLILNKSLLYSQEIKATVTVNTELLSYEVRQYVSTLKDDLERYINNQKFTDLEWEGNPIPVDINIYFTSGRNNLYTAKMVIVARRFLDNPSNDLNTTIPTLMITETNWKFEYSYGANLSFNPTRFDRFTSVIDFYMFLVIGFDLDSYEEIGGQILFEKAKNLVQLGATHQIEGFETFVEPGTYSKYNIVRELTDPRYYPLRKLFFSFYVDGMDKLHFNRVESLKKIEQIVEEMANFKQNKMVESSILLQLFFDTHSQNLAVLFNNYPSKQLFQNLMYLDPGHSMLYRDSMDGKINN